MDKNNSVRIKWVKFKENLKAFQVQTVNQITVVIFILPMTLRLNAPTPDKKRLFKNCFQFLLRITAVPSLFE